MRPNTLLLLPASPRRQASTLASDPGQPAEPHPGVDLSHEIDLPGGMDAAEGAEGPAQVGRHGLFADHLERARRALLARFDYDEVQMQESGYDWPIIEMRMKYVAPIDLDRPVRIRATIVEWEHRLRINYLISCLRTGRRLHKATSIQIALHRASQRMCWVCPSVLRERLGVAALAGSRDVGRPGPTLRLVSSPSRRQP